MVTLGFSDFFVTRVIPASLLLVLGVTMLGGQYQLFSSRAHMVMLAMNWAAASLAESIPRLMPKAPLKPGVAACGVQMSLLIGKSP